MIQMEHIGEGKMRFAIKDPSIVEIIWMDGKLFAHSSPYPMKTTVPVTPPPVSTTKPKTTNDELDFLKDIKTN